MKHLLAGMALVLLAGCSSAPATTPPTADAIFLDAVKTNAPDMDDATLIRVGHIVCEQYAKDPNPSVTTWLVQIKALTLNGFNGRQAGVMTGAATGVFCPQYSNLAPKRT